MEKDLGGTAINQLVEFVSPQLLRSSEALRNSLKRANSHSFTYLADQLQAGHKVWQ